MRSWDISKMASEKLIEYTLKLPVLDIKEVVCYNQSRNLSADFVESFIDKLLTTMDDFQESLKFSTKNLIEKIANLTFLLGSRTVTIFNDQFDAFLQEKIQKLQSSFDANDLFKLQFLEKVRTYYIQIINSPTHTEIEADIDTLKCDLFETLNSNADYI